MATAITLEQFQTFVGEAIDAKNAGDYTTAKRKAGDAEMVLKGLIPSMNAAGRSYTMHQAVLVDLLASIDAHERTDNSARTAFTRGFPV